MDPAAEDAPPEDAAEQHLALADGLEAALVAALQDTPDSEEAPVGPSVLARARSLVVESEYMAMMKSYDPFPQLRPAHRDFRTVLLLSVLLGFLGADRFYAGRYLSGSLKLVTAGGLGIWWIIDIVAILSDRAEDRNGHRFSGDKKHLTAARVLTLALLAGLARFAAIAVAPTIVSAVNQVNPPAPEPAPAPTWAPVADADGTRAPAAFTVTGSRLRFTYNFAAPVVAFIHKAGDTTSPGAGMLLKDAPSSGVTEFDITPGAYILEVRTQGTAWSMKIDELALPG